MALPVYTAAVGYDAVLTDPGKAYIQLVASDGYTHQVWSGSDTPTARVWLGDDQESLFTPTCAWTTASEGQLTVTIARASTATLVPGTYRLQVKVTRASDSKEFLGLDAWLKLTAAPGTADPLTTYCTLNDMQKHAGDLVSNLLEISDQTGFAEQRHDALLWTHRTILSRARTILNIQMERHAPVESTDAIEIDDGVDAGPSWGPSIYPDTSIEAQMDDIRGYLEFTDGENKLLTDTDEDQLMIEANALYALHLVYRRQLGLASDGQTSYQKLASQWKTLAIRKLFAWAARIDRDGDGSVILRIGA